MGKPDALLQRADHPQGTNDNLNITLLAPETFHIRATQNPAGALLSTPEQDFVSRVRRCWNLDDTVVRALKELEDNPTSLQSEEWAKDDDLVTF